MKKPITTEKVTKGNSKYDNQYFKLKLTTDVYELYEIRHIIEILDNIANSSEQK